MDTGTIFYIILGFFLAEFLFNKILGYLNTRNWSEKIPKKLKGIYDEKKYKKSMKYEAAKYYFGIVSATSSCMIMFIILITGGFGLLDTYLRTFVDNPIILALLFFGVISVLQTLFSLPFSYYSTFVIEQKFGFNTMDKKLFFIDTIKSLCLGFVIGAILLSLVVWIYLKAGNLFWLYAWIVMSLFSIMMMMLYSNIIVPLFNKQTPLKKGKLRDAIQEFAKKVDFKLDNIYVIDGSKRSKKSNAYFSGFGPKKRIVLYDTLIDDLEIEELVAVLAHEIGHYKKKHTLQMLVFSVLQTGFMLYIMGLALAIPEVSYALGAEVSSFHIGIIAFGILFTPISMILGIFGSILSRKNEYEADAFAKNHYKASKLVSALKKLSANNLSNLTPHPAYEFVYYSHPTTLKRIEALQEK